MTKFRQTITWNNLGLYWSFFTCDELNCGAWRRAHSAGILCAPQATGMPFITPRSLSKSLPKSRALLCAPSENCSVPPSGGLPSGNVADRPSRCPLANSSSDASSAAQRSQALQDRACPSLSLYFLICKQEMRAPSEVAGKRNLGCSL